MDASLSQVGAPQTSRFSYKVFEDDGKYGSGGFINDIHSDVRMENWSHGMTLSKHVKEQPNSFRKFMFHQENISSAPLKYLKSDKHSLKRKAFDITIGGPAAAVIDTVSAVYYAAKNFLSGLFNGLRGIGQTVKTRGQTFQLLNKARENFVEAFKDIKAIVKHALRMIPVIGVFVSYGAKLVDSVISNSIAKVVEGVKSVMPKKSSKGPEYQNPVFETHADILRSTSSSSFESFEA